MGDKIHVCEDEDDNLPLCFYKKEVVLGDTLIRPCEREDGAYCPYRKAYVFIIVPCVK